MRIELEINGVRHAADVEPRRLLADFIREDAALTGTHLGCEHGICGACTVQLDGVPVRSCLLLAVQAQGYQVRTVEALAEDEPHPLQRAFHANHALQCGFCTPGFLMTLDALGPRLDTDDEAAVRQALAGNLCRCTGYQHIVDAVRAAAREPVPDDGAEGNRDEA